MARLSLKNIIGKKYHETESMPGSAALRTGNDQCHL